jgi:hypothetical protein
MSITSNKRKKLPPKYHVYFDQWTGEIISVGQRPQADHDADEDVDCLITESAFAHQISRGIISEFDYLVHSDDGTNVIKHRSECVLMRTTSNSLFVIPTDLPSTWDISVRLYLKNMKMVFRLNDDIISRLPTYIKRQKILAKEEDAFEFYIIPMDRPDHIIERVKLTLGELHRTGFVAVDVTDTEKYMDSTKCSIMTRRQFRNYHFEVVDDAFVTITDAPSNNTEFNWQYSTDTDHEVHVALTQTGKKLSVNNMVSNTQLDTIGLTAGTMDLYVIGRTPDDFIDTLTINITALRDAPTQTYDVDYDLADVTIIHKDPYFKIGKRLSHDTNQ